MATKKQSWQALLDNRFFIGDQIPTTGEALSKRLTESLQLFGDGTGLPADGVTATITAAPNIELLQANLSGFNVVADPRALENAKAQVRSDSTDVADRLPAEIHKVLVKAHPLTVRQIPAEFDAQVENVPFNWVTDKQGKVWFGFALERPDAMHGEFTMRIEKNNLKRAVTAAVAAGAEQKGFRLLDLDFDIRQVGQDLQVAGSAKLRKGILTARAEARATVQYDPKTMVATVTSVDLHSANPAVAMILRMADGEIAKFRGKSFDLNSLLAGSNVQLKSLEVKVGAGDLRLEGKF